MPTLTRRRPRGTNPSRPRPGFTDPSSARKAAVAFLAEGVTAAGLRMDTVPGDMLLTQVADAMDALTPAMKYFAIGRTAEGFRSQAADPEWVRGTALLEGITGEQARAGMLAAADGIVAIAAGCLTRVDCYFLTGLDQFLGAYPGTAALNAA
jgi:hypothetical protein